MLQNEQQRPKARVGRKSNSCTECNRRKVKVSLIKKHNQRKRDLVLIYIHKQSYSFIV